MTLRNPLRYEKRHPSKVAEKRMKRYYAKLKEFKELPVESLHSKLGEKMSSTDRAALTAVLQYLSSKDGATKHTEESSESGVDNQDRDTI